MRDSTFVNMATAGRYITLLALAAVSHAQQSWWFPGTPVANSMSVVQFGASVRFTILTAQLVRLEYAADGAFEDRQTMVTWNRNLAAVDYSVTNTSTGVIVETSGLLLNYSGSGAPFDANNLEIQLKSPSFSNEAPRWTPGQSVASDPGNLFGTFHTLDQVDGDHAGGLNCSLLDPTTNGGLLSFYPCDFGLISKSGWSLVDDSRRPVINNDWMYPNLNGVCNNNLTNRTGCFQPAWNPQTPDSCEAAGCCWDSGPQTPVLLNLYYSHEREDHFTDADCNGCEGLGYVLERPQGWGYQDNYSAPNLIPLNLYWNSGPTPKDGPQGDNVVSTFPPTQPGYQYIQVQGYIFDINYPQPPNTTLVKLWYSAAELDHFTTASPADEAEAMKGNYTFVGSMGYMPYPNSSFAPSKGPRCYQRTGNIDWYFFGHGMNYTAALGDFASVSGKIPIPRRHWLGMSWSRWDESTTQTVVYQQLAALQNASFPVSTFIFDMQWHLQPDWTGYTWNTTQYNVSETLAYIHAMNIPIAVNLHDADGVAPFEAQYAPMAIANGIDPSTNATVQFAIDNQTYAQSLHDIMLGPLALSAEHEGADFWWTDWQQGLPGVQHTTGITPTMILNHYRFMNYSQPGSPVRGNLHSRYGGLGSHRYPSQFGGDVNESWTSIQFMVEFTTTASNVLVAHWGHEMMRAGGGPDINTELFLRTMQFGAYSPIFTNWGNYEQDDNLWLMSEPFLSATQQVLADRAQNLPYRYNAARIAYDTGVGLLRPMYYASPAEPDAYSAPQQYNLGDDMLVAPVYVPSDPETGLAPISIWFPPSSSWVDFNNPCAVFTGAATDDAVSSRARGGSWQTLSYPVEEVPVFIRSNAVIPMTPYAEAVQFGAAARDYASLQFNWYPGSTCTTGSDRGHTRQDNAGRITDTQLQAAPPPAIGSDGYGSVYEDDGISSDYQNGVYATTTITYKTASNITGRVCTTFTIQTAGSYPRLPALRDYSIWILPAPAPSVVTVDGITIDQGTGDGQPSSWWLDAGARSGGSGVRVYFPSSLPTNQQHSAIVCW